jgi:predicted ribosome quality control (RQC) complex YloA/Tae2 family protein
MSLGHEAIAALVQEISTLAGSRVAKAWAGDGKVVLRLRGDGGTHDLLIGVGARDATLCIVETRPATSPGPFQALLRREVAGRRLDAVEQARAGDRVVRLSFSGGGHLVAELMGARAQVYLLDADGRIRAQLLPEHRLRPDLAIGSPYVLPAPPKAGRPSRAKPLAPHPGRPFPWSAAAAEAFFEGETRAHLAEQRRDLLRHLSRETRRRQRLLDRLTATVEAGSEALALRHRGELLKQALGTLRRGMRRVVVRDWADPEGAEVEIELDPRRTPAENLETLFKRARRLERGATIAAERARTTRAEIEALESLRARAKAARSPSELEQVWDDAKAFNVRRQQGAPGRTGKGKERDARQPFRCFVNDRGDRILVGRSARDNHALTFRVARGRDLWVHARDVPGSHVVVPLERGTAVHPRTLLDAALLAIHFSRARGERAEVHYTERKHLRHPPGAAPGLVSLARARTLLVRPDPARIARLFEGEDR